MMKLYTYFRSSASYRVRIALNYKGLAYESAFVNLPESEHLDVKFGEVNPQQLVPTLEDAGRLLSQSLAIIEYLDEVHPGPKLVPSHAFDRHYVRALSQIVACEIHPLNNLRTLRYVKKTCGLDEEGVNSWYRYWIAEGFGMMEAFLVRGKRHGKYCFGDQVSMADCCLVPQVFNAQRYNCDLAPYPTVMGIHENCMKLDAFIKGAPERQADAA